MISDAEMKVAITLLDDICKLEEGLSDWEIGFIESVAKWNGNLTEKQYVIVRRIWAEKVDGQDRCDAEDFSKALSEDADEAPPPTHDYDPDEVPF